MGATLRPKCAYSKGKSYFVKKECERQGTAVVSEQWSVNSGQ